MKIGLFTIAIFGIFTVILVNSQTNEPTGDEVRDYWYSKVSKNPKPISSQFQINETDEQIILAAIPILLSFEGDNGEAAFCGSTRIEFNPPSHECTVELASLFYISYLFHGKGKDYFAGGVGLVENGQVNSPDTVKKAFALYYGWYEVIKQIGLRKAREIDIDPLKDSGITWYGGRLKDGAKKGGIEIDL